MSSNDDLIKGLMASLEATPDNIPVRKHLAELLLQDGRLKDVEIQLKEALHYAPHDMEIKLSLADIYFRLDKISTAIVIIEEIIKDENPSAKALLMATHLYLKWGEPEQAAETYRRAVFRDPAVADSELEAQLDLSKFKQAPEKPEDKRVKLKAADIADEDVNAIIEKSKIAFKDVGGMEQLKKEIEMKIIQPLQHPEIYQAYGKTIGGGILMYGPPGCGKTYLARATAGEIQGNFISVGIHDVVDMYLGQSEQNLHELFEVARNNAPCVLFFDEIDALGAKRTDMRHSAGRPLINQFLSELDGVDASNEGVLILAATNAPWHVDSAFRRPGRFDRVLFVPPPDVAARTEIVQIMLKGKPVTNIDFGKVAAKAGDFSGADIKALVDVTIEQKLEEALKRGVPAPIVTKDLLAGIKRVRPTTKEWFSSARNYALYANQSGLYDDIIKYLKM